MEISILASGSNGNCMYIEGKQSAILIDAGKSCIEIEERLERLGKSLHKVQGLLISHEHTDHIRGTGPVARKYNIPVYINKGTLRSLYLGPCIIKQFENHLSFRIGEFKIMPLNLSHDAADPSGFIVESNNKRFGVITDTGVPTEQIKDAIGKLNGVLIESNHDIDMLINGPYPGYLKQRILSSEGHLSNIAAGHLIYERSSEKLKEVILGHLSGNNNTPALALKTFETLMKSKIKYMNVAVASRDKETGTFKI